MVQQNVGVNVQDGFQWTKGGCYRTKSCAGPVEGHDGRLCQLWRVIDHNPDGKHVNTIEVWEPIKGEPPSCTSPYAWTAIVALVAVMIATMAYYGLR